MSSPRVLHLGKYLPPEPGGIERFSDDLLSSLHRKGAPVAMLGHRAPQADDARASTTYPVFSAATYGTLIHAPMSPGYPLALARAVRAFRPDLLHIHMPNISALCVLVSVVCRRLPWIVHWHSDVVASRIDRRLAVAYQAYRPAEQALLRRATAIIATSESYAGESDALTSFKKKLRVIPLGIDPAAVKVYDPALTQWANNQWPATGMRALFVGRLSYYKGLNVLLEAVAGQSGLHVVIAGDGVEREQLENHAQQNSNASLLGRVTDAQRNALLECADVLVLPSLEKTEAFGLVLLEALVTETPVIVSEVPGSGMGDVVRRARHGLLVPPGDADGLRTALVKLRDEEALRTQLVATATQLFNAHYHIDSVAQQTRDLYESLL